MNAIAPIGHNGAPDPIDEICATFEAARSEAENWLDGTPVENEGQMLAVDALRKSLREFRQALEAGEVSAAKPLHDAWKAEKARWKPTLDDVNRIEKGLVALVDGFKRKLAAEKESARKEAERAAWEANRAAREAAEKAAASDIEAQRAAAEAMRQAEDAQAKASAASKDTVKGLRTVTHHEITDEGRLLNWIVKNDRAAVVAFIEEWARLNHKTHRDAAGLRVWDEKEAF